MIAAALGIEDRVNNLWKHGPLEDCHDYPDFGKYMPIYHFKCFKLRHPTAGVRRNTSVWRSMIGHGIYFGLVLNR